MYQAGQKKKEGLDLADIYFSHKSKKISHIKFSGFKKSVLRIDTEKQIV